MKKSFKPRGLSPKVKNSPKLPQTKFCAGETGRVKPYGLKSSTRPSKTN